MTRFATIEEAFTDNDCKALAKQLTALIVKREPFSNRDECLEAIGDEIASKSDEAAGAPVSLFFFVEVVAKYAKKMRRLIRIGRYSVTMR
ncbi:MAG: hypothetical protein KGZ71_09870 [Desulfobulbaceae bacterium]|nr:hypothetical protein [Desulfobulbaceae bacterium]